MATAAPSSTARIRSVLRQRGRRRRAHLGAPPHRPARAPALSLNLSVANPPLRRRVSARPPAPISMAPPLLEAMPPRRPQPRPLAARSATSFPQMTRSRSPLRRRSPRGPLSRRRPLPRAFRNATAISCRGYGSPTHTYIKYIQFNAPSHEIKKGAHFLRRLVCILLYCTHLSVATFWHVYKSAAVVITGIVCCKALFQLRLCYLLFY